MKSLKESLINKNNINKIKNKKIPVFDAYTKNSLETGDAVELRDGTVGIVLKYGDVRLDKYKCSNFSSIVYEAGNEFQHFILTTYTNDLKSVLYSDYDIVKVAVGLVEKRLYDNPEKLKKWLQNKNNYEKIFYKI